MAIAISDGGCHGKGGAGRERQFGYCYRIIGIMVITINIQMAGSAENGPVFWHRNPISGTCSKTQTFVLPRALVAKEVVAAKEAQITKEDEA